jgi:hypothetical protein
MNKGTKNGPQLVYIEQHEIHVNVTPLVELLCERFDCKPTQISESLDRIIQFLGENVDVENMGPNDGNAFKNSFSLLFDLKKMFAKCTIIAEK